MSGVSKPAGEGRGGVTMSLIAAKFMTAAEVLLLSCGVADTEGVCDCLDRNPDFDGVIGKSS